MNWRLQTAGLTAMTFLAGCILYLIMHTFDGMISKVTPDGKVPVIDAGLFTALLLSFREVIGVIKSIWDHADRSDLTTALSNSTPIASPNPPAGEGP
jgi:hypothetical protein